MTIITQEIKSEKYICVLHHLRKNWKILAEQQGISLAAWIENKISMALASNSDFFKKKSIS